MESSVVEFLNGFNGSPTSDWATALCFAFMPVAFALGWLWAARSHAKKGEEK